MAHPSQKTTWSLSTPEPKDDWIVYRAELPLAKILFIHVPGHFLKEFRLTALEIRTTVYSTNNSCWYDKTSEKTSSTSEQAVVETYVRDVKNTILATISHRQIADWPFASSPRLHRYYILLQRPIVTSLYTVYACKIHKQHYITWTYLVFRTFQSLQASTQSCEAWAHRWHPSVVRPFGWFQYTMTLPPPNQRIAKYKKKERGWFFSLETHETWKEAKGTGLFMASFWGNGFSVKHNVFLKWFAKVSDERRETRNELKLDKMGA